MRTVSDPWLARANLRLPLANGTKITASEGEGRIEAEGRKQSKQSANGHLVRSLHLGSQSFLLVKIIHPGLPGPPKLQWCFKGRGMIKMCEE